MTELILKLFFMNKAEFIAEISQVSGFSKNDTEKLVDATFDVIGNALKNGEEVRLLSFGIFTSVLQKAKTARNPRTGEKIDVPERMVPKFKPGKPLKDKIEKK